MAQRLAFLCITAFWLTMNVLLWRSESSNGTDLGSAVPVMMVWQKMLAAPDDSNLEIFQEGKKTGSCRWSPNVGAELETGKTANMDFQPEGRVKRLSGYTIDVMDGYVDLGKTYKRWRFNVSSSFSTNHVWRDFSLRLLQRPVFLEVNGNAAEKTVRLALQDEGLNYDRKFSFEDLRNPAKLFEETAGTVPLGFLAGALGGFPRPDSTRPGAPAGLGLEWDARNDWMRLGHAQMRVYRLHARLLDRHQIVVIVSRVGEILRVELPGQIHLVNSAFANL